MPLSLGVTTVLASLLVVAVSGCVPIPIPNSEPIVVYGNAVAEEAIRETVVPGQTREDVVQRLGTPAYDFGAGRAYVYPWTQDRGSVAALTPSGQMLGPWRWAEARLFIVVFDDDGRAVKTGTVDIPPARSVSSALRAWMDSQKLKEFIRPQPGRMLSRILVYRRENAPCMRAQRTIDVWAPFQTPFAPVVTVDGQTVGDVLKGEFLELAVAPGAHLVVVDGVPPFRHFEFEGQPFRKGDPASLTVHLEAGQTVYAETWVCAEAYQTTMRYFTYLESRDAEQLRAESTKLKSAWP
jgi:outer membrane protein assembly factor BamE (lipoprotein component of BamABCDE complex)